ncbi:MAG: GNAT family N-acetyltransferase [Pseudomonadota bacterium]
MIGVLQDTPVIETERLILRAPQAGDEEAFIPFAMSARAEFIGGGAECDLGLAWRIMAIIAGHWTIRGYGSFVLVDKATGTPIGSAGPWHPAGWPEQELGWTIWNADYEGTGLAHEAVLALRHYVYETLKWPTAVSYIDERNARSIALAERLGCRLDKAAEQPKPESPCLIYRHPGPAQ